MASGNSHVLYHIRILPISYFAFPEGPRARERGGGPKAQDKGMGQVRNLKKTRLTPPGATAHVGAASEKAGVQGGCPRGSVFEKRTMQTTQKFGVYRQTSVSSVNQRPKPAVYVGSAALVNQSIIYHLPTRCSTYESDPDSSPRKEGKRVPRKLTSTLLYTAWSGLGGRNRPKGGKKRHVSTNGLKDVYLRGQSCCSSPEARPGGSKAASRRQPTFLLNYQS